MSTKFEQLLDYLINEEMEKANELFHDIVVEKSRSIYETLIAEEESQEEDGMDESMDDEDKNEMDESAEEELEDSYMMDSDEESDMVGGDATDDMLGDVEMSQDDDMDQETGSHEEARDEIEAAIAELTAALEKLGGGEDSDLDSEFDDQEDSEVDDQEDGDEESDLSMGFMEGRRMTREYNERVGNDWEKNSQKTQGQIVGANTGEKMPTSSEGRSPISSGSGKPTTGATAANILGDKSAGAGTNTGTAPGKVSNGIAKTSGDKFAKGMQNVDGVKSGVKTLNKQPGHGPEKKGGGEGQPAGAGTGEKSNGSVNAKSVIDSKIG
jgi:hypothetical protein